MYNIMGVDTPDREYLKLFGDKYEETDEMEQANALISYGKELSPVMLSSRFLFAVTDLGPGEDLSDGIPEDLCSYNGISIFSSDDPGVTVNATKDYIENGNIAHSVNFPDVSLGDFGDDTSRVSIVMRDIEEPIMMAAMMFNGVDLRAVAGGKKGHYSYALVASRDPIISVPKVEGILKVRVLQDI